MWAPSKGIRLLSFELKRMQPELSSDCKLCETLPRQLTFENTDGQKFAVFHNDITLSVIAGKLVIEVGELQWQDHIDCLLRCHECGKRFELQVETYHGRGGW